MRRRCAHAPNQSEAGLSGWGRRSVACPNTVCRSPLLGSCNTIRRTDRAAQQCSRPPAATTPTVGGALPAIEVGDDRLPAHCRRTNKIGHRNVNRICQSAEPLSSSANGVVTLHSIGTSAFAPLGAMIWYETFGLSPAACRPRPSTDTLGVRASSKVCARHFE